VKGTPPVFRAVASLAAAACLLVFALPRVVGTTVTDLVGIYSALSVGDLVVLTGLWMSGLLTHSFVLTGALPGLSRRRALTLNLTGSAVANVLPLGGAAGMSLNYAMIRRWRLGTVGFASYTLVTNAWNILVKLALPAAALLLLLLGGTPVSHAVRWTAAVSSAVLVTVVLAALAALASRRSAAVLGGLLGRLLATGRRLLRRPPDDGVVDRLRAGTLECRDRVLQVVGRKWPQLSFGMAGYAALQAGLLWACIVAVGGHLTPMQVLAGFAVERVLTLVVLTPGAVGFTEAGTAAALTALGGDPAVMAAGVLLYRGFTYALEIPVGGLWLGGWLLARRLRPASTAPTAGATA
jgi:uncharacterized membrane protein YbhN (UPF0104 family)